MLALIPSLVSVLAPVVVAAVPGLQDVIATNPVASAVVGGVAALAAALSKSPVKK